MYINFNKRQEMKNAIHTNDQAEIGRLVMKAMSEERKVFEESLQPIVVIPDLEKRIEALALVRPLELIYRKAYPNDERICLAIDGLADYIAEKITDKDLIVICSTVEQALNEATIDAEECPDRSLNKYWKAADAAEALEIATRPILDICELKKSVDRATQKLNG